MKTSIIIGIAVMASLIYAFSGPKVDFKADTPEGIQFHKGSWNEALQLAKKENKLIFLDIYATWCGPCKKLKRTTFANNQVGKLYNSKFINVALDGEVGDGAIMAQKLGLTSYPSLYFIDAAGKVVTQTGGYHNAEEFMELGKKVGQ